MSSSLAVMLYALHQKSIYFTTAAHGREMLILRKTCKHFMTIAEECPLSEEFSGVGIYDENITQS